MGKRESVLVAILVVMGAALLGVTRAGGTATGAAASEQAPAGTVAQQQRASESSARRAAPAGQCRSTPQPLGTLCQSFQSFPEKSASPGEGGGSGQPAPKTPEVSADDWQKLPWVADARGRLQILIATVGDPETQRDTLRFDRAIESIQNAAETADRQFERFWFPWRQGEPRDDRSEETAARRMQPGVLLFRPKFDGAGASPWIAVFLVGESPVQGVNRAQFVNAVRYADALSDGGIHSVAVVGPNFSGSFLSLTKAIDDAAAQVQGVVTFRVISPSATGSAGNAFRRPGDGKKPPIFYQSVVHSDAYADDRFSRYIEQRWDLHPDRVAVLSESGTAFGASTRSAKTTSDVPGMQRQSNTLDPPEKGPLSIAFPKDIARLRNAHPQSTARNLFTRGGEAAGEEQALTVPLTDLQLARDMVPTFAPGQRPVSQEAVLIEIASVLREERISLVRIVATDALDAIFLGGFLRSACPDVRILIPNSDMLFARAAETLRLPGSLGLTAFPLFLRNQIWWRNGGQPATLWPMSSRLDYGVFNACLALLLDGDHLNMPERLARSRLEYSLIGHGDVARPPLWLTIVGTNGYWPVAVLDDDEKGVADPLQLARTGGEIPENRAAAEPVPVTLGWPSRPWMVAFWMFTVGGALFGLLVIWAQLADHIESPHACRLASLAVRPHEPGAPGRACLLVARALCLAAATFAISFPVWTLASGPHGSAGTWQHYYARSSQAAFILSIAGALSAYLVESVRSWRVAAPDSEYARGYHTLALVFVGAFAYFVIEWLLTVRSGTHLEPLFFAYRSFDLFNGVSPVLPALLLTLGLFAFAQLHTLRQEVYLTMAGRLPEAGDASVAAQIRDRAKAVRDALGHPLLSSDLAAWLLFLLGALTFLLLVPFIASRQSVESGGYDRVFKVFLSMLYLLVLLAWARLLYVWVNLRAILGDLERDPVRFGLDRLPRGCATVAILEGGGRYDLGNLLARSVDTVRSLVRYPLAAGLKADLLETLAKLDARLGNAAGPGGARPMLAASLAADIHGLLADMGDRIGACLREIRAARSVDDLERGAGKTPDKDAAPEALCLAREFIALQYATFAGNALLQVRNMLYCLAICFFLGMICTLVYPFRSQDQIIWAATATFILLGLPVAVVIVQMERNAALRRLTDPSDKGGVPLTLLRLGVYGALPVLGLVSSHFPAVGRFLSSLLEPALKAVS